MIIKLLPIIHITGQAIVKTIGLIMSSLMKKKQPVNSNLSTCLLLNLRRKFINNDMYKSLFRGRRTAITVLQFEGSVDIRNSQT
jgi:hypothetical protein